MIHSKTLTKKAKQLELNVLLRDKTKTYREVNWNNIKTSEYGNTDLKD